MKEKDTSLPTSDADDALLFWIVEDYNQGFETSVSRSHVQSAFCNEMGCELYEGELILRADFGVNRLLKKRKIIRDKQKQGSYYHVPGHVNTHLTILAFRKNPVAIAKPELKK